MHRALNMAACCWLRHSCWPQMTLLSGHCRVRLPSVGKGTSRRGCSGAASFQKAEAVPGEEEIVIPRRKTWGKLAVLQTLASTVKRDPTASHYMLQDDPFLIPKNIVGAHLYSSSKESGKNAAKYIINTFPQFFERDIAEPHIPCLMPENLAPQIEGVSEAALKERIQLRKVKASVDMFDQLQQTGAPISLETTNALLDLLCVYGDKEPTRENQPEEREESEEAPDQALHSPRTSNSIGHKWRENNNAERIFNLMPERNAHSYCTMIRGMVKHGASSKAHSLYADLLNDGHTADVHTFNALILGVSDLMNNYPEKWKRVNDLLNHMVQQKVQPNLLTFNSALKVLRTCGVLGKSVSIKILMEMKALNIEPSLASYDHLLSSFYKAGSLNIIYDMMEEIEGKTFAVRDPDDVNFFYRAMLTCLDLKDIELAYRVNQLLETGDNWKLIGDMKQHNAYYKNFFALLCLMEQLEVVRKWYKEHVPSVFYPDSQSVCYFLQALDAASHLEMIPEIWEEVKWLGFIKRLKPLEEMLALMAREAHPQEMQMSFADCAADIKRTVENEEKSPVKWTATALSDMTLLFARAGRIQEAWSTLTLFEENSRVPSHTTMDEVLTCMKQSNSRDLAIQLVKLAAAFGLPTAAELRKRVMEEFEVSEEQKNALDFTDLESVAHDSD